MHNPLLCDVCEGTGRIQPHPYREDTFRCHAVDCVEGYREATPSDLDGVRVRYRWMTGSLVLERNGSLTLCTDDDFEVVNLNPSRVEILNG